MRIGQFDSRLGGRPARDISDITGWSKHLRDQEFRKPTCLRCETNPITGEHAFLCDTCISQVDEDSNYPE